MRYIENIIERMKQATETKTDLELAAVLGIRSNTISTWRKRQSIPYEHLDHLALAGVGPPIQIWSVFHFGLAKGRRNGPCGLADKAWPQPFNTVTWSYSKKMRKSRTPSGIWW